MSLILGLLVSISIGFTVIIFVLCLLICLIVHGIFLAKEVYINNEDILLNIEDRNNILRNDVHNLNNTLSNFTQMLDDLVEHQDITDKKIKSLKKIQEENQKTTQEIQGKQESFKPTSPPIPSRNIIKQTPIPVKNNMEATDIEPVPNQHQLQAEMDKIPEKEEEEKKSIEISAPFGKKTNMSEQIQIQDNIVKGWSEIEMETIDNPFAAFINKDHPQKFEDQTLPGFLSDTSQKQDYFFDGLSEEFSEVTRESKKRIEKNILSTQSDFSAEQESFADVTDILQNKPVEKKERVSLDPPSKHEDGFYKQKIEIKQEDYPSAPDSSNFKGGVPNLSSLIPDNIVDLQQKENKSHHKNHTKNSDFSVPPLSELKHSVGRAFSELQKEVNDTPEKPDNEDFIEGDFTQEDFIQEGSDEDIIDNNQGSSDPRDTFIFSEHVVQKSPQNIKDITQEAILNNRITMGSRNIMDASSQDVIFEDVSSYLFDDAGRYYPSYLYQNEAALLNLDKDLDRNMLMQVMDYKNNAKDPKKIFVNIGIRSLCDDDYIDRFFNMLENDLQANNSLIISLSQNQLRLMTSVRIEKIMRLSAEGVRFCLSDIDHDLPDLGELTAVGFDCLKVSPSCLKGIKIDGHQYSPQEFKKICDYHKITLILDHVDQQRDLLGVMSIGANLISGDVVSPIKMIG